MAAIKGVWVLNETLPVLQEETNLIYSVYATVNNQEITQICCASRSIRDNDDVLTWYTEIDFGGVINGVEGWLVVGAYDSRTGGWKDKTYRTLDFGETEQEVDDGFYTWLTTNAVQQDGNIQIHISQNGKTTLLTAGKYCAKDVEMHINVAVGDTSIEDGLITRTLTEYTNDRVTTLGKYAFRQYYDIKKVSFPLVEIISGGAFINCTALHTADFGSATHIESNAFSSCSNLSALILRGNEVVSLYTASTFDNSGVANGTGYIYVPDNLVESYKTATNWVTFASQIKPISQLEV